MSESKQIFDKKYELKLLITEYLTYPMGSDDAELCLGCIMSRKKEISELRRLERKRRQSEAKPSIEIILDIGDYNG